jgi:AcrR family transcriptional regulator
MIEIARTAGVARATLYNHYPDVPSILADAASRHNAAAIEGLRQTLAVVSSPTEHIKQTVRYVAAISVHGHTLDIRQDLPAELRQQLTPFDDELDHQILRALTDGTNAGEFGLNANLDTSARLVRHMLNGVSELVAASPDTAATVVSDATETILAALGAPVEPTT